MFWRKRRPDPLVTAPGGPVESERLLALSHQLRSDMVAALVREGENLWQSLAEGLAEHIEQIEKRSKAANNELKEHIGAEITAGIESAVEARLRGEIDSAISDLEERVNARIGLTAAGQADELAAMADRIGLILDQQRRRTDTNLAEVLENVAKRMVVNRVAMPGQLDERIVRPARSESRDEAA